VKMKNNIKLHKSTHYKFNAFLTKANFKGVYDNLLKKLN